MKLVVGLGNPGEKYANTRHNVGFKVVDKLVTSNNAQVTRSPDKKLVTCYLLPSTKVIFAKPQTFMNFSGSAAKDLVVYFKTKLADLWVVHDDLDIPLGQYKIQQGHGPRLHYGVNSIEEKLGSEAFWRVRIGVDNRTQDKEQRPRGEEYVLQEFTDKETIQVKEVVENIVKELMSRFAL